MPTYDYQCRSCGTVIEVIHSMLESGPSACEQCGGELRRVLYPTGIIFKGSGFYRTDSRKQDAATPKSSSDGASTGAPAATGGGNDGGSGSGSAATGPAPEAKG